MSKTIHRLCPICSRDNRVGNPSNYSKNGWTIKNCLVCGFVYLEIAPVYESLVKETAWEKTSEVEKIARRKREPLKQSISDALKVFKRDVLKRNKLFRLLERHVDDGKVLDIGCGGGGILAALDHKYTPFGIEISEYLARTGNKNLKERGGAIVHNDAISGLGEFDANFFSGILMSAFLEHEINPKQLLQECLRTLKRHGIAIIKVPNYSSINRVFRGRRWCGFRYPDHVNYFTPDSLQNLCRKVGFTIHQFDLFDRPPFSDNMWMVVRKD